MSWVRPVIHKSTLRKRRNLQVTPPDKSVAIIALVLIKSCFILSFVHFHKIIVLKFFCVCKCLGAQFRSEIRHLRGLRQLHVRRLPGHPGLLGVRRANLRLVERRLRQNRRLLLAPQRHGQRCVCVVHITLNFFVLPLSHFFLSMHIIPIFEIWVCVLYKGLRRALSIILERGWVRVPVYFVNWAEANFQVHACCSCPPDETTQWRARAPSENRVSSNLTRCLFLCCRLPWIRILPQPNRQTYDLFVQLACLPDLCWNAGWKLYTRILLLPASCVQRAFLRSKNCQITRVDYSTMGEKIFRCMSRRCYEAF